MWFRGRFGPPQKRTGTRKAFRTNPPDGSQSEQTFREVARHGKRNMTPPETRAGKPNIPEALLRLRSVETELRAIGRGEWPPADATLVADLIRSTRIQFLGDAEP